MKTTKQNVSALLNEFGSELISIIKKVSESYPKEIIKGYKLHKFSKIKDDLLDSIAVMNRVIDEYCILFDGKRPGLDTANEIISLYKTPTKDGRDIELRRRYLKHFNIQFPNFKETKILEIYDFPLPHDRLISSLSSVSNTFDDLKYFNEETGLFEYTEEHEAKLIEQHSVYLSREELVELICLHLACVGLSNLKSLHPSDYSFKELPEIDHRLVKKIKIDRTQYGIEDGISVDLNAFINSGRSNDLYDLLSVDTHGSLSLPIVKIKRK